MSLDPGDGLKRTPLHALHVELGAKLVPFAGYEMPVQFRAGVMAEHQHTRAQAGLFDVSHMGQVILRGADAAVAFESLVPVDVIGLPAGRQRYAIFTNDAGGIRDDLMVANRGDHLFAVVNASCKGADIAHMRAHLGRVEVIERTDRALLALQGPLAEAALEALVPGVSRMRFMDIASFTWQGAELWISRSGYTGEDGYEISVPEGQADAFARALLADVRVMPVGLGARDSLRLEAGLCLYGNDIDTDTTPVEAALAWAIQKVRRTGGARAGGFPGADVILAQIAEGTERLRVGLLPEGRAPMRAGTPLYRFENDAQSIGSITSGGFAPALDRPVAMGYVPRDLAQHEAPLWAELRGKRLPLRVTSLPFRPATYRK